MKLDFERHGPLLIDEQLTCTELLVRNLAAIQVFLP